MLVTRDPKKTKIKVWHLDSGCSNHMTSDEGVFLDMDHSIRSKVRLENGEDVEIKGKGSIGVETKQGNKAIQDVIYVSDLDENLLSIGQLLEHDYVLHFEGLECFSDQKRHLVAAVKMTKNRSFPLHLKYVNDMAFSARVKDDS